MQNQFCDGYSVSFSTFDEMRAYHEALSRESLWLHCSVSELRVMPVTSESAPCPLRRPRLRRARSRTTARIRL